MAEKQKNMNTEEITNVLPETMDFMDNTMKTFLSAASVDAVYAKPVKSGDTIIIPAAEVLSGMGFGVGGGGGTGPGDEEDVDESEGDVPQVGGAGVGGGGGGRVLSRPVAVVIASPNGVRVEPVVDATKIALAMFTAVGFMVSMLARMRRTPRNE